MAEFTQSIKFIMTFLVLTILISTFAGQKVTYYFLMLTFGSMMILNYQKVDQMLGGLKNGK